MTTHDQIPSDGSCARGLDIPAYLAGELAPDERRALEAHLADCPRCARTLDDFRAVIAKLKQAPEEPSRRDLAAEVMERIPETAWHQRRPPRRRWASFPGLLRLAAVLLALAAMGGVLLRVGVIGSRDTAERAASTSPVERARLWLQAAQQADGGWTAGSTGGGDHRVGVSSLALMAFMEGNPGVFRGPHAAAVRRGADYLVACQDETGLIGPRVSTAPYNHGMATLALLDASAVESNATWRAAAEKGLRFLCSVQADSGGWGYLQSEPASPNTSASIWPLQALLRGEALGVTGLRPGIDRGLAWMQSAMNGDGLMGYTRANDFRYGQDTMTAAGFVCFLKDLGTSRRPEIQAILPAIRHMAARQQEPKDFYQWFFLIEAVDLADVGPSSAAREAMTARLAELQRRQGADAGSWDVADQWGQAGGRVYSTALAAMAIARP